MKARLLAVVLSSTLAITAFAKDIDVTVGDVPKDFKVRELEKDFVTRAEMVAMRDGVKLNTRIFIPKGAKNAPILMDRTPYNVGIYEPYVGADQFLDIHDVAVLRIFGACAGP